MGFLMHFFVMVYPNMGGWKRLKTSTIFSTISFNESRFFQSTKQFKNFSLLRERKSKSTEKYLLKSWKKERIIFL